MSKIKIACFGEVDTSSDDYFEGHVTLGGRETEVDLNFENYEGKPVDWAGEVEHFLGNLAACKANTDRAILAADSDEGTVEEYIQFHLDELDNIDSLVAEADPALTQKEQLRALLVEKLERIWIYPGSEPYATWDYMIDSEHSDEILVVYTDNQGEVENISWES